jgi:hypothetical protein
MAIQREVFYADQRHIRITSTVSPRHAQMYRVERDLVLVAEFSTLAQLVSWLREQGFSLADLEQD